ncbi:probable calcium-binding protein CML28 [Actinidia eriantha]|uniref:probable calcium-binding protein CML28 n=1 Tax=Actinidia eriantha TaxID=165200 RepID=UPI00258E0696|nr:probable calcium-binding protein CML28 [Actinidia eriantha]
MTGRGRGTLLISTSILSGNGRGNMARTNGDKGKGVAASIGRGREILTGPSQGCMEFTRLGKAMFFTLGTSGRAGSQASSGAACSKKGQIPPGRGERDDEADTREAFNVFDQNGDGFITVDELRSVLASLGLKQSRTMEDWKRMIMKVDGDGDVMVNFIEFKEMMRAGGFAALT